MVLGIEAMDTQLLPADICTHLKNLNHTIR